MNTEVGRIVARHLDKAHDLTFAEWQADQFRPGPVAALFDAIKSAMRLAEMVNRESKP